VNAEALVRFEGVYFEHQGRPVVRDFNLELPAGQTIALLGRSGSGKTTALKLVNAMLYPSRGWVAIEGRKTTEWDVIRLRRRTGYVIQDVGLFPHQTVAQNIALVPKLEGWPEKRRADRADDLLQQVGLPPDQFRARYPHELSGGQRQRVGVARALAADPPLLLLDEPFSALDPVTRLELQELFRNLVRKTSIFVTHDLREALVVADRIILLDQGVIAVDSDRDHFLEQTHPEAVRFRQSLELPCPLKQ
jgi:osmoprotectant transport system ATP-binding protein